MKKCFILFLFLGLSACDKESKVESTPLIASKIIGSWQIVCESYSIGGPEISVAVENGAIYDFRLDGTFTFDYSQDTSLNFSGTFSFEEEILTIRYKLPESNVTRKLKVLFDDNKVVLNPWDPVCIEGCSTTLRRLD